MSILVHHLKVSIVLFNSNVILDMVECLESLEKMKYLSYELIIVDNDPGARCPHLVRH